MIYGEWEISVPTYCVGRVDL